MFGSLGTWFRRQTVASKLTTTALTTSAVTLIAACSVFVTYDYVTLRSRLVRDVTTLADIVGSNSTAALTFSDPAAAADILHATAADGHILRVRLFAANGSVLATYMRPGVSSGSFLPPHTKAPDREAVALFEADRLRVQRPIALNNEVIGSIVVESDTTEVSTMVKRFAMVVAGTLLVAFVIAFGLSRATARLIFGPIARLIEVMRLVRDGGRYDVRAEPGDADEIGELIDQFNATLSDIQSRDQQLVRQQDGLERTVNTRTAELQISNTELVNARDRAMEASRAKSEFLANMSHEIRTPMNGIIGMTDLVLDSQLTLDQRDNLATVRTSADTLLSILNDILDFSKIESRKLELESVPFSPRALIADALKPFALRAEQKGLELICDIDPGVPAGVVGDPTRLQQVLANLVGNALKFTDTGDVVVAVREDARADGRTTLHVRVIDTGIGIAPEKHDAIFEAFRQADGSTTRRFGGTGLGLTISATLAGLMGGRLWVESTLGTGSTFHFTVVLDVTDAPGLQRVDAPLPHLEVLIVDDNDVNRRVLAQQITRWGMTATVVTNGRSAVEAITAAAHSSRPFQLVLLDAKMPGMDGFAVAAEIATRPELAGATIMMLSSSGEFGDQARCATLGISVYLTKPVYAADLLAAIERAIGANPSAAAPLVAKSRAGGLALGAQDRRSRILLVEDNVVNQRVASGLLARRGHQVVVAHDGLEALALLEHESFDLVLMDLQMPVMGGLEATVEIRMRERVTGQHVRIVAMTAHAMNSDRERCLAAGMDGYLSKPIHPPTLFAVVEQDGDGGVVQTTVAPPVTFDQDALLRRLSGDRDLMTEVIGVFLEQLPVRLAAIREAVTSRNADALEEAANALKEAAASLSAGGLSDASRALERLGAESQMDGADAAWQHLSVEASKAIDVLRRLVQSAGELHPHSS